MSVLLDIATYRAFSQNRWCLQSCIAPTSFAERPTDTTATAAAVINRSTTAPAAATASTIVTTAAITTIATTRLTGRYVRRQVLGIDRARPQALLSGGHGQEGETSKERKGQERSKAK